MKGAYVLETSSLTTAAYHISLVLVFDVPCVAMQEGALSMARQELINSHLLFECARIRNIQVHRQCWIFCLGWHNASFTVDILTEPIYSVKSFCKYDFYHFASYTLILIAFISA